MRNEGWYEMSAAEGGSRREWRPRQRPRGVETGKWADWGRGMPGGAGRGQSGREPDGGGAAGAELRGADPQL